MTPVAGSGAMRKNISPCGVTTLSRPSSSVSSCFAVAKLRGPDLRPQWIGDGWAVSLQRGAGARPWPSQSLSRLSSSQLPPNKRGVCNSTAVFCFAIDAPRAPDAWPATGPTTTRRRHRAPGDAQPLFPIAPRPSCAERGAVRRAVSVLPCRGDMGVRGEAVCVGPGQQLLPADGGAAAGRAQA